MTTIPSKRRKYLFPERTYHKTNQGAVYGDNDEMEVLHDGKKGIIKGLQSIMAGAKEILGLSDKGMQLSGEVIWRDETWDDMRIVPGSFDRPGASDPTITSYTPGGSGTATYLYQFDKTNIVSFTVQLPHSYAQGTDMHVHAHWTPGANGATESGNTVGWKLDYSWANINGVFGTMQTVDLSDTCDGVNHKHQMTPDVLIKGNDRHISSMLICNFKRTDTGADDTWTNATGPLLLEIDFHFRQNSLGSYQRSSK